MAEINPYQPPEAQPDPVARTARSLAATLLRAVAVVVGFALLADPFLAAPDGPVRIGAKFLGVGLMFAAFMPFGRANRAVEREVAAEDL